MNIADRELEKLGFNKVYDGKYVVSFERINEVYKYTQCLNFYFTNPDEPIVVSFEKGSNSDGYYNVIGLNYLEMKCATQKLQELQEEKKGKL